MARAEAGAQSLSGLHKGILRRKQQPFELFLAAIIRLDHPQHQEKSQQPARCAHPRPNCMVEAHSLVGLCAIGPRQKPGSAAASAQPVGHRFETSFAMLQARAIVEQGQKNKPVGNPSLPWHSQSFSAMLRCLPRLENVHGSQTLRTPTLDTLPLGAVGLPWLEQPEVNQTPFMLGGRHCCQPLRHRLGGHRQLSPKTKLKLSKSNTCFEGEALVATKLFPRSASLGSGYTLRFRLRHVICQ